MILRFLGTADADPDAGRLQSGILVTAGGRHLLFDCGDGIATRMWNDPSIDLNALDAVFISHFDADHFGGLFCLLQLVHQRIKTLDPASRNRGPLRIFLPSLEMAACVEKMLPIMRLDDAQTGFSKIVVTYPDDVLIHQLPDVGVQPFATWHTAESHGFVITAEGRKLVYSADICAPMVLCPYLDGSDLVIVEGAHFPPSDISTALAGHDIGTTVVTHLNKERYEHQSAILEALAPLAEDSKVLIASDGLELTI